jgi:type IV pilus assembly protein PilM
MQFEINEVSGQSGGEVAADYRRLQLPTESDEETVLVSLARNTWLHPRLAAARGAGLDADGGCPNSVALFNAFLAHGEWKDGESTFLVNIGRENIDLAIQRDGELIFARNMSGGGQMFTEAIMGTFGLQEAKAERNKVTKGDLTPKSQARYPDSTTEKLANAMLGPAGQLVSMIQSSVMICRAQTKVTDLRIDRLVLAGGTARMTGVQQYFQANMSVPVEVFDPAAEIDVSGLDPDDQQEIGESGADFAVAVGLAETLLNPNAFRLEVLTAKEKAKRHFLSRTIWAVGAAVVALVFVVLLFKDRADAIRRVREANAALEDIKKGNKQRFDIQTKTVADELDARSKEVAIRARRMSSAFFYEVVRAVLETHNEFTAM